MVHQQVEKKSSITPEEFLEGYHYIERAIQQSSTFKEAIHLTLKYFDRKLFGTFSTLMIIDQVEQVITECLSNSLSEEFKEACRGLQVERGRGATLTAAKTGKVTITTNISKDPSSKEQHQLASIHQLDSCWAVPIFDYQQNRVIAVFSIYTKQARTPTKREIEIIKSYRSLMTLIVSNYIQSNDNTSEFAWLQEIKETGNIEDERFSNELLCAIENKEIIPYYQPIYRADSEEIIGFEALARWNHPIRGILPPSEFIDYAEEHQLIDLIDDLVMKRACRDIKELMDRTGKEYILSINISALHINQPIFSKKLQKVLKDTGFPGDQLAIEITETALMQRIGNVSKTIETVKQMGVRISIDDFGTSYSSLNYLKYLSVDMIKLDRSFVQDVIHSSVDQRICKTIIQLAEDLNLKLLAEGIESKEHYEMIRDFGCKIFQGFYFSKPISYHQTIEKIQLEKNH